MKKEATIIAECEKCGKMDDVGVSSGLCSDCAAKRMFDKVSASMFSPDSAYRMAAEKEVSEEYDQKDVESMMNQIEIRDIDEKTAMAVWNGYRALFTKTNVEHGVAGKTMRANRKNADVLYLPHNEIYIENGSIPWDCNGYQIEPGNKAYSYELRSEGEIVSVMPDSKVVVFATPEGAYIDYTYGECEKWIGLMPTMDMVAASKVRKHAWMTWSDDPDWWDEYGDNFEDDFWYIVERAEESIRYDMSRGAFDDTYVEETNGRVYLTVDAVEGYSADALDSFGYPYNDEAESRISLELTGDIDKYPEYQGHVSRLARRKAASVSPYEKVRDWYISEYPDDELGYEINGDVDFAGILDMMADGIDFYDAIGVGDSIVRERVFNACVDAWNWESYEDVYQFWLHGVLPRYIAVRKRGKMASWHDFNTPVSNEMNEKYLPSYGDGDNMATQAVTAVNKLIYKWFNDGDVYDNTYGMEGWCNDISGSANWLYNHIPETQSALMRIRDCGNNAEYESILHDVFTIVLEDPEYLEELSSKPKVGDAYDDDGPFEFVEHEEEWNDDDDWW